MHVCVADGGSVVEVDDVDGDVAGCGAVGAGDSFVDVVYVCGDVDRDDAVELHLSALVDRSHAAAPDLILALIE